MTPTPYPELNEVLSAFVEQVQAVLAGNFVAAYLVGSFAVGDFDEHSDVDFLVVVQDPLSSEELAGLQAMHGRLYEMKSDWARHLEGSYFPQEVLNRPEAVGTALLWYLDNTSQVLELSTHDNQWVERWVAYHHGIILNGPAPQELFAPVSSEVLRAEVARTMRDWEDRLLQDPSQINSLWYQSFVVVSYCRMLQTMQTGEVRSKAAGVQWALQHLEARWYPLIERAWQERPDPGAKCRIGADPNLCDHTLQFVRFAIEKFGV